MVCRGGRPLAEVEQNNGNRLGTRINSLLAPHQLWQLFKSLTKNNDEIKIKSQRGAEDHFNYKQHASHLKYTEQGDTDLYRRRPRERVGLSPEIPRVCL